MEQLERLIAAAMDPRSEDGSPLKRIIRECVNRYPDNAEAAVQAIRMEVASDPDAARDELWDDFFGAVIAPRFEEYDGMGLSPEQACECVMDDIREEAAEAAKARQPN